MLTHVILMTAYPVCWCVSIQKQQGATGMQYCGVCATSTSGPVFCGTCAARLHPTRRPTKAARLCHESYLLRMEALAVVSTGTDRTHARLLAELAAFMQRLGAGTSPFLVTPTDVIKFLMSKDSSGHTVVHQPACPFWAISTDARRVLCQCPKRAGAVSLRSTRGLLQGAFRNLGLATEWSPLTGTGNPVNSAEVLRFENLNLRQQALAGVTPRQSPLFREEVYVHLMKGQLALWRAAWRRKAWKVALLAARDAFFYALLWYSGMRATDVLRVLVQQLTPAALLPESFAVDAPAGRVMRLQVTVTKPGTTQRRLEPCICHMVRRTIVSIGCITCWKQRQSVLKRLWSPGCCSAALDPPYPVDEPEVGLHPSPGQLHMRVSSCCCATAGCPPS
jgi:hypothetical protein